VRGLPHQAARAVTRDAAAAMAAARSGDERRRVTAGSAANVA